MIVDVMMDILIIILVVKPVHINVELVKIQVLTV